MTVHALRNGPAAHRLRAARLIVVLRAIAPRERLLALVSELADAGVRAFEITMDSPSARDDLVAVRSHLADRAGSGCVVGAGTVLTLDHLDAAQHAGADFAVAPILDPELVGAATAASMPFVPGALTPTEIVAAWDAGATFVKLFPASAVGPTFVRELRGPIREVELIPTGGIDAESARAFLDAGAAAVGIGSAIVRADDATRRRIVESALGR